jgi:hypothetical protein
MKRLKLEVGKTYRNRRGEKVTIVKKYDWDRYPHRYLGDDNEWYAENGKFDYYFEDTPIDLIEEVEKEEK